jgi:hypothetical protein
MPAPNQIEVNKGDNLLLVGTEKGAFLFVPTRTAPIGRKPGRIFRTKRLFACLRRAQWPAKIVGGGEQSVLGIVSQFVG